MEGAGKSLLRAVLFCDAAAGHAVSAHSVAELHGVASAHRGEVVDSHGVGIVAGFAVAGDAIDAGLELASRWPSMTVGVALGEVLVEDADWIGTPVVEAARLQQLGEAGQVLVSAVVAHGAAPSEQSWLRSLGLVQLKGLPEQTEVFEVLESVEWESELRVALAIDMVQSTQLLTRVGDAESLRHRRVFENIVAQAVEFNGGRTVDQSGDGVLMHFSTVSAAAHAGNAMIVGIRTAALRADIDSAFAVRASIACGPANEVDVNAYALLDLAGANELVADAMCHLYSRDRGVQFNVAGFDHATIALDRFDLPVPRALRGDGPFVGRQQAHQQLVQAWKRSVTGTTTVVEVTGNPGMGKTRLVSELAAEASLAGSAVLYGGCDPELDIPYGPLVEALTHAAGLQTDFADIVSELRITAAPRDSDGDYEAEVAAPSQPDREDVFASFADVFQRLARLRPLVLVLDDVHWANTSTLLVLQHIVTAVPACRLLVIATYRPMEIDRGHPFNDLRAEMLRIGVSPESVALEALSTNEIMELVEHQLPGRLDETATELVDRVRSETSGNPFYAQELLRSLISTQALLSADGVIAATAEVDALPIPDSVRGVVTGRLNQLDDRVYRLLSLGAVAGPQFSLDVASAALDQPFDDIVELAEAAEHVSLVTEGDQPRTYAFAHAIVRATLLDDLSATRLAAAHESLAVALEHLPGDRTDALAHHWSQAAGPLADENALIHIGRAAERDVAALAWEAAISRYRLLLDRLETTQSNETAQVAHAWLGLGAALRALGDADYLDAVIEAGRCARRLSRPDLLAQAAIGSMKPGLWFANANETNETIIGFCEDALDGLADDDPVRVQVLSIMATSLAFESDRSRRVELVHEAVALASAHGEPTVYASALIAEHLALWDPTTLERRREIADELGRIARRRDLPEVEFLAGFFRASLLLETCKVAETRDQLESLRPLIERTGNFWFFFLVERMRVGLDIALDVAETASAVDALFEQAATSQADAGGTWAAQHGGLAIHAGRLGDMADSLRSAAGGRQGQGIWSNALVIALAQRGEEAQARELAVELKKPNLDFMWLVSMQMRAEVGYLLGDKEICLDAVDELLPFRDRLGVIASGTLTYGLVSTSIGEAALGAGDYDLAVDVLGQAVRDATRIKAPFFASKSAELLDEALEKQRSRS